MRKSLGSLILLVLFIGKCGNVYSASEIIVSALNRVYCLDHNGTLKWSYGHSGGFWEESAPAIGDIDNDGKPEVVVGADNLYCFSYDGNLEWSYPINVDISSPAIANIDTIGDAEIIVAELTTLYCINGNGTLKWTYGIAGNYGDSWIGPAVSVANIDTTTQTPEVFAITPSWVYCLDSGGNLKWSFSMPGDYYVGIGVADINLDGSPEIIVTNTDRIYCLLPNGTQKWVHIGAGIFSQPAIADINLDTKPEIVVHNAEVTPKKVIAFQENASGTGLNIVWEAEVIDVSGGSAPAPVLCDIDGDGDKDVLLVGCTPNIHGQLYILNGLDGRHPDNSSGACYIDSNFCSGTVCERGVAVADIDDDGHLDIVGISSNNGGAYDGVAVLECSTWASGRDLFTSHLYHTTDINDDVTVPKIEPNNWQSHNTWLTQLTTGGTGFGAPSLKWDYSNFGFGIIIASISVAPIYEPPATEERHPHEFGDLQVFCKGNKVVVNFSLDRIDEVNFHIFDVAGRLMKVIELGALGVGRNEHILDLSYFVNGVYFIQACIGEEAITRKLLLIR